MPGTTTVLQRGRLPKEAEGICSVRNIRWSRHRFNGAASRRRRKAAKQETVRVRVVVCFNGAASRRRRKDKEGPVTGALDTFASTGPPPEGGGRIRAVCALAEKGGDASTGPPPEGGGRVESDGHLGNTHLSLQRGRLPKEAEGGDDILAPPRGSRRFNGAASRRRRKAPNTELAAVDLQAASTGPPPEGGGRDGQTRRER